MTKDLAAHTIELKLTDPPPPELAVGADVVLKVAVWCPSGCDLRGLPVTVTDQDGVLLASGLAAGDCAGRDSAEIALQAPRRLGEFVWTVHGPAHQTAAVRHEGSTLAIAFRTLPQGTSLAVWDIPSPVVTGARFAIKVGAKSAAGQELRGARIEIRDDTGATVAQSMLGGTPWPDTSALYWTEVELSAPAHEGLGAWRATFAASELELPHDASSSTFSVAVVRPPEHRLTVKVVERETANPVENAIVRAGAFRATTNPGGLAQVAMPKGTFDLAIWKVGYEAPVRTVVIEDDMTVEVEVLTLPEEDPDAVWTM
ncbi:MAG: hypothetical protein QOI12_3041 [Alphaproteobacteria bacterium]|jgi:hypothetical protein|nr:hypothetical protein [Alphaproteobacteria bacterium]